MPVMSVNLRPVLAGDEYAEATYAAPGSTDTSGVIRRKAPSDGAAFDVEGGDGTGFLSLEFLQNAIKEIKARRSKANKRNKK